LVTVNAEERREIQEMAASANLSVSSYLRKAALNYPIRSKFDYEAVCALALCMGT
jgi:hypothetical protein